MDRIYVGALLAVSLACRAPGGAASIEEYLSRVAYFGASGEIVVSRGGVIVVDRAFGRAVCADDRAGTPDDLHYVASLSKSFTAAAILSLEKDGALHTSDRIGALLPDVPVDKSAVTVHDLLVHRSGIGRLPRSDVEVTKAGLVAGLLAAPLRFPPGQRTEYSNEGYELLAAIAEGTAGMPFETFVRRRLFEPAGLDSTSFVTEGPTRIANPQARACRGELDQGDPFLSHRGEPDWTQRGSTGVVSTARDLHRWAVALWREQLPGMFAAEPGEFGYGWLIDERDDGRRMIWHDGLMLPEGWSSQVRIYPDDDVVIAVVSGRHDVTPCAWQVARDVDRLLFGGKIELPPPTSVGPTLEAAMFTSADGDRLDLGRIGESSFLDARGQAVVNVVLGVKDDVAPRLALENRKTATLFDAVQHGTVASLPGWQARFGEAVSALSVRYGPLQGFEVLHTVPDPDVEGADETFVSLRFARGESVLRVVWSDGELWTVSDRGALIGATPSVAVQPGRVILAPTARDRFLGFDPGTGQRVQVELDRDASGKLVAVELRNGEARIRLGQ